MRPHCGLMFPSKARLPLDDPIYHISIEYDRVYVSFTDPCAEVYAFAE
jgi:hypothetical protein